MSDTPTRLTLQSTGDGSLTFYDHQFQEALHSAHGAKQEAIAKFVLPAELAERALRAPRLILLDICYGLGYNSAAALSAIWQANPDCRVELWGFEVNPQVPRQAFEQGLLRVWPAEIQSCLAQLVQHGELQTAHLRARLLWGDARQTLQAQLAEGGLEADAVLLDPFSPPHCPQLWTVEFLGLAASALTLDGNLVTYSCAASVRAALHQAGLHIGSTPPVGRRMPGTIAACVPVGLPLSVQEQEHLRTRAAVPYRDPSLSDPAPVILSRRQQEQQSSPLEPTSHWKRRWLSGLA